MALFMSFGIIYLAEKEKYKWPLVMVENYYLWDINNSVLRIPVQYIIIFKKKKD